MRFFLLFVCVVKVLVSPFRMWVGARCSSSVPSLPYGKIYIQFHFLTLICHNILHL